MFIQTDAYTLINTNNIVSVEQCCPVGQSDDDGYVYTVDDYCIRVLLTSGQTLYIYGQDALDIWNKLTA